MATQESTIDELFGITGDVSVRARRMFGEYGLYVGEKVVGFVCDDQLLLKITDAGLAHVAHPVYAQAYPGSKDYLLIDRDQWYEAGYLLQLLQVTANDLPIPKPKQVRKKAA